MRLRSARRVLLDTSALIYFFSGLEPYVRTLESLLRRVQQGDATAFVSVVTEAELRVGPEKIGDSAALEHIDDFLSEDGMRVVPADRRIARRAAAVRASTGGLRLPDAIIIATALEARCDAVLGNDYAWAKVRDLPFVCLDDLS